ncbi:MAG TPA: DNA polymerase I [Candidatus Ozemobacteraceae bacterium]|nr:DNA polymerase I [Candidatus Ozemobacteraceae bacterium]
MPGCLLIDGNNILFRAFYAFDGKNLRTRSGLPTGALFGFTRMLLKLLRERNPEFVSVAFDVSRETFRHRRYPEYKAHRRPTPEELLRQMPLARKIVEAMGIAVSADREYEADDMIGTLAERFKHDTEVTIVTGDRDLLQLIDERVIVHLCVKGITETVPMGPSSFVSEYGFPPRRIVDLKALWGDSSDNIPGVDGIGEKKALTLIREFGSLEEVYANLEKVSNLRMRENLAAGKDSALLSYELATICRTVPELGDPASYRWDESKLKCGGLADLLRELEFTSLAASLGEPGVPAALPATEQTTSFETGAHDEPLPAAAGLKPLEGERLLLTDVDSIAAFIAEAGPVIAFDIETDGFDPRANRIVGVSLAVSESRAAYIPLRHSYLGIDASIQPPVEQVYRLISEAWRDRTVAGHNLKFDLSFLKTAGVPLPEKIFDTILAAYVLDPTMPNGLKPLSEKLFGVETVDFATVAGKRPFSEVMIEDAAVYAGQDALLTMRLFNLFVEKLGNGPLGKVFFDLELPLLPLLLDMETIGIGLNRPYLKELAIDIRGRMKELEASIHAHAGTVFNVNSGKQLQDILFTKLGLTPPKKTKTGFSTDSEVLLELAAVHPICRDLLDYRELAKLENTYVETLGSQVDPETGLIHTSFNQTVTATGRLSSSNPNLQNIPIKTELGRKVRRAFIPPRQGDLLLSIDYSQIELRLLAHFSNDEALVEAFKNKLDIHAMTAGRLFGKQVGEVSDAERKIGKTVNFGIIYGISAHGLAAQLGISRPEAQKYIDGFFSGYPGVMRFFEENLAKAKAEGRVETMTGRVRPLPELREKSHATRTFGERVARNTPLQGTAADLVKKAMLEADQELRCSGCNARLILQIHDEIVFTIPAAELAAVGPRLLHVMEHVVELRVPLICDAAAGTNLADLHEIDFSRDQG